MNLPEALADLEAGRITLDDLVEQFKVSTFTVVPSASERAAVSRAAV
jgi:hypothetical protein